MLMLPTGRKGGFPMQSGTPPMIEDGEITLPLGKVTLAGHLAVPAGARGIVLFAHGSASSHLSPRNRAVADVLCHAGLATLLFDLLTREEEARDAKTAELRFDIPLLADRLTLATRWLLAQPGMEALHVGYFGASTGAGAALLAASRLPEVVRAVVSRGGRPDLAGAALTQVHAPVLLLVGGNDPQVLALNQQVMAVLEGTKRLVVIPGASHLFEEPGTLEQVAAAARDWFLGTLAPPMHVATADQPIAPSPL